MTNDAPLDPYACLTPADQLALCRRFDLPTPTPDVPFAVCVERHLDAEYRAHCAERGVETRTPAQAMYAALATTTDVRLMIAAHALRRGVTVLPPDRQLSPEPLPPLRHAPPKSALAAGEAPAEGMTRPRSRDRVLAAAEPKPPRTRVPPTHVLTRLAPNPRKRGTETWERYERYQLGLTVAQLVERGVRRGDVIWDLDRDYVAFAPPETIDDGESR